MSEEVRFGEFFKQRRIASGLTLREFCRQNGLDSGNISKLERGRLSPPRDREKLASYAKLLGLEKESSEWYTFFDLAAAATGTIPHDVLQDQEVVEKLPVLFRTLRGQQVSDEQLDALVEKLRGA